jgi:hypothetical protein
MVNPFDRTFFRFVLGFTLMLSLSFAIFFFIGRMNAVPSTVPTGSQTASK